MNDSLFDSREFMDEDYRAALEFCRAIAADEYGTPPDELEAGVSSSNFCPIAVTLSRSVYAGDMPDEITTDEMERIGGSSLLFQVGHDRVSFPADFQYDWSVDLTNDDRTEQEIEILLTQGYDYDESGGEFLRLGRSLPVNVQRFVSRFDAGDFPGLHLPVETAGR